MKKDISHRALLMRLGTYVVSNGIIARKVLQALLQHTFILLGLLESNLKHPNIAELREESLGADIGDQRLVRDVLLECLRFGFEEK